jgi:hypothetical protein
MKTLVIAGVLLLGFFPAFSQKRQIQQLPVAEVKSNKSILPDKVKEAFIKEFGEGHQPFAWSCPDFTAKYRIQGLVNKKNLSRHQVFLQRY